MPRKQARRQAQHRKMLGSLAACAVLALVAVSLMSFFPKNARPAVSDATTHTNTPTDAESQQPVSTDTGDTPSDADANSVDAPNDADAELSASEDSAAANIHAQGTSGTSSRTAVIRAVGDVIITAPMLKYAYDKKSKRYDFSRCFSMIGESLSAADFTIANVEGPTGGKGGGYRGYPTFNTPPSLLTALKGAGVDMLTLANNHALDTYFDGLLKTVDNVEKAGLLSVGAYRSKAEFDTPMVVELNGIKVGITNYTDSLNRKEKVSDKAALVYGVRHIKHANVAKDIKALRGAGAEFVVVFMHWGKEYIAAPPAKIKKTAKRIVAAGADLIIGGHPHTVQPFAYVNAKDKQGNNRRALVLYSMGNFLTHQRGRDHDSGVILEFTLAKDAQGAVTLGGARYVPVWVWLVRKGDTEDCRVLPVGKYLDKKPKGMSERDHKQLKRAWNTITKRLGKKHAQPADE